MIMTKKQHETLQIDSIEYQIKDQVRDSLPSGSMYHRVRHIKTIGTNVYTFVETCDMLDSCNQLITQQVMK